MQIPWTLPLGRLSGTPVRVHLSLALVLAWVGLGEPATAEEGLIGVLIILGSVLLHELGHAGARKILDLPVDAVLLYPFGGLYSQPRRASPRNRLVITLAGPLANAAAAFGAAWLLDSTGFGAGSGGFNALTDIVAANTTLAAVNLLPLPPFDLEELFRPGETGLPNHSPRFANALGITAAVGFFALGVIADEPLLFAAAVFAAWGSVHTSVKASTDPIARSIDVRSLMTPLEAFQPIRHGARVHEILFAVLRSHQFVFPVLLEGRPLGFVFRDDIVSAATHPDDIYVSELIDRRLSATPIDATLADVLDRLDEGASDPLTVEDNGATVGILFREQVLEALCVRSTRREERLKAPESP